jgi:membrane associated rhomboid family serine protease
MTPASVGFQCPECAGTAAVGARGPRLPRSRTGKRLVGPVTAALVSLNVGGFVVTAADAFATGGNPLDNYDSPLWESLAQVPLLVQLGDWWRVLTAAFMHVGLLHLALNMLALVLYGTELERALGRWRYLGVYVAALLGGSAAIQLFGNPLAPVAGASAAIYGLLGAFGVLLLSQRQSLRGLVTLLALNILISVVVPGISLIGHLGGLVAGAAATGVVVLARGRGRAQGLALGALGALLLALAVLVPAGVLGGY